jgi:hypothetical protein
MALTDPQSITISDMNSGTAISMPLIQSDATKSVYANSDGTVKFTVSHQSSAGRTRHLMRIDIRVVAANPLDSKNEYKSAGIYIVIDEPDFGFTDANLDNAATGVFSLLASALRLKVLGGQH